MNDLMPRYIVYPQSFLSDSFLGGSQTYSFSASELHHPLQYVFGKSDGMVSGKYKKARFFGFEFKIFVDCSIGTDYEILNSKINSNYVIRCFFKRFNRHYSSKKFYMVYECFLYLKIIHPDLLQICGKLRSLCQD